MTRYYANRDGGIEDDSGRLIYLCTICGNLEPIAPECSKCHAESGERLATVADFGERVEIIGREYMAFNKQRWSMHRRAVRRLVKKYNAKSRQLEDLQHTIRGTSWMMRSVFRLIGEKLWRN